MPRRCQRHAPRCGPALHARAAPRVALRSGLALVGLCGSQWQRVLLRCPLGGGGGAVGGGVLRRAVAERAATMSSIGTGVSAAGPSAGPWRQRGHPARPSAAAAVRFVQYDLSASTFSPDGRVFQVEYAMKAVENSSTAIGIRCKDGVVFGVEKLVLSKLYEEGSNKRLFNVDRHVGMAVAGLLADARSLADIAREEASNFRSNYGYDIPLKHLADRVAMYVHAYTLYSAVRPFGCSFMLGSYDDDDGAQLYMIDPSGVSYGYWGCAIGKARQAAKTEIEKLQMKEMTCRDVVKEVAKIIYIVHDEVKDKAFELELSWVGEITNGKHEIVPKDIREEAEKYAKESLKEEDESDDDNM
uniref:Proteasome subunit alpha type-3 n=69 Tax=Neoaves TaxID=3078114 RepID=A0A8C4V341_FALTI